jgi:GrpB-like predicted nucleotidyltransferase (UPF0157 family)
MAAREPSFASRGRLIPADHPERLRPQPQAVAGTYVAVRHRISRMRELDEPVEVSEYQEVWPRWFEQEQRALCDALRIEANNLAHTGSTAVPRLAAKPIVDLMLGLSAYPPSQNLLKQLEALGWDTLGEAGVPGRLYFRMRHPISVNLHIVQKNGEHWTNNLAIRDYLRTNDIAREAYSRAKYQAIADGACTLLSYSAAKAEFVRGLLQEALVARSNR